MGFDCHFEMGVYQKLLVVTTVALKSCPSSKLAWDNSFWSNKNRWIRPATKYLQTQNSSRNEKDAQRHLEPGTPNISTRPFFWTLLVSKTFALEASCKAPT